MRINLQTLSHEPLVWKSILPAHFKGVRLPGGTLASAQGAFGSVCIQEFRNKHFRIQYKVFDVLQNFISSEKWHGDGLHSRLILKGDLLQAVNSLKNEHIYTNTITLINSLSPHLINTVEEKCCIIFDTFFARKFITEILKDDSFNKELEKINTPKNVWSDWETLAFVQDILNYKYENKFRKLWFENRVRDLLFKYLLILAGRQQETESFGEKEINAVMAAQQLIDHDVTKHISVPELSKRVMLNEFRFKFVFKKMFGLGPYEYLLKQRMKKAKQLFEEGYSLKEVSAHFGYRSSNFIALFRQHFGFTPGSVKKRG